MKNQEYQSLREDMRHLRSYRLTVYGAVGTLVVAGIGWASVKPEAFSGPFLSALLTLAVAVGAFLSWILHLLAAQIGTYIRVFHETGTPEIGWERRSEEFGKRKGFMTTFTRLRVVFGLLYMGLFLFALAGPLTLCKGDTSWWHFVFLGIAVVLHAVVMRLCVFIKSHEAYREIWQKVADKERSPD